MRRLPDPTPAEARRAEIIKAGSELANADGAFWRLMKQADVENIPRWCQGERIRGTEPQWLFNALAAWMSSAVVIAAGQVGRKQIQEAARGILNTTAKLTHAEVIEIKNKKLSADMLRRGLTVVKD